MTMRAPVQIGRGCTTSHVPAKAALKDDTGSSLVELALILPVFLVLLVGAIDFGRAYYIALEVQAASHAGAVYGIQHVGDSDGIESAAEAGSGNLSGLSTSSTYGCECSDGTNASDHCAVTPACTYNYVTYVNVTTTVSYSPVLPYPGIAPSITITRATRLRSGGD